MHRILIIFTVCFLCFSTENNLDPVAHEIIQTAQVMQAAEVVSYDNRIEDIFNQTPAHQIVIPKGTTDLQ